MNWSVWFGPLFDSQYLNEFLNDFNFSPEKRMSMDWMTMRETEQQWMKKKTHTDDAVMIQRGLLWLQRFGYNVTFIYMFDGR